ncbi:MAG: hypothetical protein ACXWL5_04830 [Candidatus Chromulinivorax sp.]
MKKIVSLVMIITAINLFAMNEEDENKGLSFKKMKTDLSNVNKITSLDEAVNWIVSGFLADACEAQNNGVRTTALQIARQYLPVSNPFYEQVIGKLIALQSDGVTSGFTTQTPGLEVIEIIPAEKNKKEQKGTESNLGSGFKKGFLNSKK